MPFCFRWRSSPFWCCFDGFVSGVCASLSLLYPVRLASCRDRAYLPLDGRRLCSSACGAGCRVLATWGPLLVPCSRCSPASEILSFFLGIFRGGSAGFLPPTAGRSIIGGTSACSSPLLLVTALLSDLRAGDCGLPLMRVGHAGVWVVVCPPLLWGWRAAATLVPLMPCASAGISFRSLLASSRLSLAWWIRRACAGLLLPRPLGARRRPLRLFTGRFLLATVVPS